MTMKVAIDRPLCFLTECKNLAVKKGKTRTGRTTYRKYCNTHYNLLNRKNGKYKERPYRWESFQ